jgi:hypothetical protein
MTYLPALHPSKRQIGLLTLTSSVSKGGLKCELHTVSQASSPNSSPKYKALSYVWGDKTIRSVICINGKTSGITTNLDIALGNLWQKDGEDVSVWADAICINQADDSEKASQVRMTGDTYSNGKFSCIEHLGGMRLTLSLASEVWIWLGEKCR